MMLALAILLLLQDDRPSEAEVRRFEELLERLDQDDPNERQKAAEDMVRMGFRILPLLREKLEAADNPDLKARLRGVQIEIERLEKIGRIQELLPESVRKSQQKAVELMVIDDPRESSEAVQAVARALVHVPRKDRGQAARALRALLDMYRPRPEEWTWAKRETLRALRYGHADWTDEQKQELLQGIEPYLNEAAADLKQEAVGCLSHLKMHAAAPRLLDLLKSERNQSIRMAAANALQQLEAASLAPKVAELVESPDAFLSRLAMEMLGAWGCKDAVPRIAAQLADNQRKRTALTVLGALGATDYSKQVLELFEKETSPEAIEAVGRLRIKEAIPKLKELVAKDRTHRKAALIALTLIGETEHIPELLKDCEAEGGQVRDKVDLLMSLNARRHFDVLQKMWQVRVGTSFGSQDCFQRLQKIVGAEKVEGETVPSVGVGTGTNYTLLDALVHCITTFQYDYTVIIEDRRIVLMKYKQAIEYWKKQ